MYSTIKRFIHVCFLHTETLYPWEIANILFKDCNRTRNSFGFIMTQLTINLWCCVLYPPCHFHSSSDWHFNMLLRGQAVLSCWILFFFFYSGMEWYQSVVCMVLTKMNLITVYLFLFFDFSHGAADSLHCSPYQVCQQFWSGYTKQCAWTIFW